MSYSVRTIATFDRQVKGLAKKYPSFKEDLRKLGHQLQEDPHAGDPLGGNCYKIRMAITSNGKGRSGGARVITYVLLQDEVVWLLSIYDKSVRSTISDKEIKKLLKQIQ